MICAASTGGTTSACAENTSGSPPPRAGGRNYLRVRGEYVLNRYGLRFYRELPPRARRILIGERQVRRYLGTTSACAENTNGIPLTALTWGNYLRVRGEYQQARKYEAATSELPPRARRIRHLRVLDRPQRGTTSACAENTTRTLLHRVVGGNYLRVRGEYSF